MIHSVIQFFRALRKSGEGERDPSELAGQVEELTRRNAELEEAVISHRKAADDLRRTQSDLGRAQRMAKIGNWRWSVLRNGLIECSDAFAEIHGVDSTAIHELMEHQSSTGLFLQ